MPVKLKLTPALISAVSVAVAVYTKRPAAIFSFTAVAVAPEVTVGATSSRLLIAKLTALEELLLAASVATTLKL